MRSILFIIITVMFSTNAKAEYDGYHISFTIESANGTKDKGYAYVAAAYFNTDSVQNTKYLLKALDQSRQEALNKRTSITYYKSRIVYNYFSITDQQQQYEYFLTNETVSSFKAVKNITIDEMIDWGYLSGISMLNTDNFNWIKSNPVKSYVFSGYLCDWQFFVHEENKKIEQCFKNMELLAKKKGYITKEIELQESHNNTEDLNNKLDRINQAIENHVRKAIEELKGCKVAVISYCTC